MVLPGDPHAGFCPMVAAFADELETMSPTTRRRAALT
jgi:hypothetical protein